MVGTGSLYRRDPLEREVSREEEEEEEEEKQQGVCLEFMKARLHTRWDRLAVEKQEFDHLGEMPSDL